MIFYIIYHGEWHSDNDVKGVFSSKEKAIEAVELNLIDSTYTRDSETSWSCKYSGINIEEIEVDKIK